MVAIVAGAGLGLFESTANQLNSAGVIGSGQLGQAKGSSYVNVSTGNLVLQFNDENLAGSGQDIRHLRTYNSQGYANDGDSDRWRWLGEKRLRLEGNLYQIGSRVIRTTGDGHESIYLWDDLTGEYSSATGSGANDTIRHNGTAWVWTEGSSKVVEKYHKTTGWIQSSRDIHGNGFDFTFNDDNQLTHIKDVQSQHTLILNYDIDTGRLYNVTTVAGGIAGESAEPIKQANYIYDADGRLSQVVTDLTLDNKIWGEDTYITTYIYDDQGGKSNRIASISQSDGTTVSFTYENVNGSYKVKTVTDQAGVTTFNYGANSTQVINGEGDSYTYHYDSLQRLTKIESPAVNGKIQSVAYEYDYNGNIKTVIDGKGLKVRYQYDANSNLILETDALGNKIERTYQNDRLVTETRHVDGTPHTMRYVYDDVGRLVYSISAEGHVTENRYNGYGLVTDNIQYTQHAYDVSSLSPSTTISQADLNNWRNGLDRSNVQLIKNSYDHKGHLLRTIRFANTDANGVGIVDAYAKTTLYTYSEFGELLQVVDVTGPARNVRTTMQSRAYDGMGRVVSVVSHDRGEYTTYASGKVSVWNSATKLETVSAYDGVGRLVGITRSKFGPVESRATQYHYDDAGRQVMVQDPSGARRYTLFDSANRVAYKVDAEGSVVGFIYDENGRVTQERRYATQVDTKNWFNGSEVVVSDLSPSTHGDDRIVSYIYDNAGRLFTKTTPYKVNENVNTKYAYYSSGEVRTAVIDAKQQTKFYYDKDSRLTGTVNAEGFFTENVYDQAGRLITTIRYDQKVQSWRSFAEVKSSLENSNKLTQHYFYDGQGRTVGVINEKGFLTETIYDVANRATREVIYLQAVPQATRDNLLNSQTSLTQLKSGLSGDTLVNITHYNERGLVSRVVAHNGAVKTNEYDAQGRLIKTVTAAGSEGETTTQWQYNNFGDVVGVQSGEGVVGNYGDTHYYDAMGRKVVTKGPEGDQTLYYYDREGRLTHVVNALGEVSQTTYNTFGQVKSVRVLTTRIDTSGMWGGNDAHVKVRINNIHNNSATGDAVVSTEYNLMGLAKHSTDAEGNVTSYEYDHFGNVKSVVRPIDDTTTTQDFYEYDLLNRIKKKHQNYGAVATAGHATVTTTYDGFGRVSNITDARGANRQTEYFDNGRTIVITDPHGNKRTTSYDVFGRALTVVDNNGGQTQYTYDDKSRTTTVTSPEGITVTTRTTLRGQVAEVEDGRNNTTRYEYDKDGNVLTVTDDLGKITTNTYNKKGLLAETLDGNNNVVRFFYDAANRQVYKTVDPDGLKIQTSYQYDALGRMTLQQDARYTQEQRTTEYIYDRNGRLLQEIVDAVDGGLNLSTRYTYNKAGNQVKVERGSRANPSQQVTLYHFDKFGRKTEEIRDPGEGKLNISTKYRYDKNGNLVRVIHPNNKSTWYIYNTLNQLTEEVNALGQVIRYNYNANGMQTQKREFYHAVDVSDWQSRDMPGRVDTTPSAQDRRTYTVYDSDDRERFTVTSVDQNNWVVTENTLDDNGNIIESRRFDGYLNNDRVNSMLTVESIEKGVIADAEVITQLRALGYRSRAWGDSSDTLIGTRRTIFAYDKANRLRFTLDANGYLSENTYDRVGNVRFQTQYALKPNSLGSNYSENYINSRKRTSSDDRQTEYRYDKANRKEYELSASVSVQANDGTPYTGRLKKQTFYNALNQVVQVDEGIIDRATGSDVIVDRRRTQYYYDKAGNQTGTVLAGWYDLVDKRVYQNKDDAENTVQRKVFVKYDDLGNAVRNQVYVGSSIYSQQYIVYDAVGRERFNIDAEGYVSGKYYDASGNVLQETRYAAKNTLARPTKGYWNLSEFLGLTGGQGFVSDGRVITHWYDDINRKTRTTLPEVTANYKASGSAEGVIDTTPSFYTASPETQYRYNTFNELVKKSERHDRDRWAHSHYYYDNIGRQTMEVDAERYGTLVHYDALGDKTKVTEYAAKGGREPTEETPPGYASNDTKNRVQNFTYDNMGRVLTTSQENVTYVTPRAGSTVSPWNGETTTTRELSTNTYNAFGDVEKSKDALGRETNYLYNVLGQVTRITEPERTVVRTTETGFISPLKTNPYTNFTYNVFGNVVSSIRTANNASSFNVTNQTVYDHAGYVVQTKDERGSTTFYQVDINGKVLRQSQAITTASAATKLTYNHTIEKRFEYDKTGRQTATLDVFGNRQSGSRQVFNAYGEVIREHVVWGDKNEQNSWRLTARTAKEYGYDKAGRVTYTRGTEGYTSYYYNLKGAVTRQEHRGTTNTRTGARVTESYHDLLGRQLIHRTPTFTGTGTTTTDIKLLAPRVIQTYDRWNNVLTSKNVLGRTTSYQYNFRNQVIEETGTVQTSAYQGDTKYTSRIIKRYSYDLNGQLAVQREQNYIHTNNTWSLSSTKTRSNVYDEVGNVIRTRDATGVMKEYLYDLNGNKAASRDGLGNVLLFRYDKSGNLNRQSYIRKDTNTPTVIKSFTYDQAGRLYSEKSAGNAHIYYKYDERGNIIERQDAIGKHTRYTFDDQGNKTKEEINTGTWTTVSSTGFSSENYKLGQQTHRVMPNGKTYTLTYRRFGEVDRETSGSSYIEYDYWQNGLLKRKTNRDLTAFSTDYHSRSTDLTSTSEYHYNINGARTIEKISSTNSSSGSSRYLTGGQTQTYNTLSTGELTNHFAYDELGRLTQVRSPSGTISDQTHTQKTPDLHYIQYRYDTFGNRVHILSKYRLDGEPSAETKNHYYSYDAEGRVLVADGESYTTIGNGKGVQYTYDKAGNKATEINRYEVREVVGYRQVSYGQGSFGTLPIFEWISHTKTQRNVYNERGQLTTVLQKIDDGEETTFETHKYNNDGFKYESVIDGRRTFTTYTSNGRINKVQTFKANGHAETTTDSYQYAADGSVITYKLHNHGDNAVTNTYSNDYIMTQTGRQVSRTTVTSTQPGTAQGATLNSYDHRGRLTSSTITEANKRGDKTGQSVKHFFYNADDQIIGSSYKRFGEDKAEVQSYFYHQGQSLANLGEKGVNITPIETEHLAGNKPTSYTVVGGESLSNVAQSIYGDSSLWYVIADANALQMSPSDRFSADESGRALRVPAKDQSLRNNATTFKPYNPAEIIGDLTPDAKILPPPKAGGCNALAIILIVVVAVVVTIFTAGAAAPALAAAAPALAGTAAGAMTTAFVAGVAGSLASQAVGVALGVSDGISLKQAFASGLTGAFTAGIGSALSSSGSAFASSTGSGLNLAGHVVQGAGSVAAGAVANKIAGLDSGFSWRAVAAGAVAGGISGGLGLNNNTDSPTGNFGRSFASSAISSVSRKAAGLDRNRSYGEIAADAFGNGLASSISTRFNIGQRGRDFGNRAVGNITDAEQAQLNRDAIAQTAGVSASLSDRIEQQNNVRIINAVAQSISVSHDRIGRQQMASYEQNVSDTMRAQESNRMRRSTEYVGGLLGAQHANAERDAKLVGFRRRLNQQIQGIRDDRAKFNADVATIAKRSTALRQQSLASVSGFSPTYTDEQLAFSLAYYGAESSRDKLDIGAYVIGLGRAVAHGFVSMAETLGNHGTVGNPLSGQQFSVNAIKQRQDILDATGGGIKVSRHLEPRNYSEQLAADTVLVAEIATGVAGLARGIGSLLGRGGRVVSNNSLGFGLIGVNKAPKNIIPDDALREFYLNVARSDEFARDLNRYNALASNLEGLGVRRPASVQDIIEVLEGNTTFHRASSYRSALFTKGQHSAPSDFLIVANTKATLGPTTATRTARHELTHLGAALNGQKDVTLHEILVQTATTPEVLYLEGGAIIGGSVMLGDYLNE